MTKIKSYPKVINILRILNLEMNLDTSMSAININQPPTISLKRVYQERLRNILKRYASYSISIIGYYEFLGENDDSQIKKQRINAVVILQMIGRVLGGTVEKLKFACVWKILVLQNTHFLVFER